MARRLNPASEELFWNSPDEHMLNCFFKSYAIWIADLSTIDRSRPRGTRFSLNTLYRHLSRRPPTQMAWRLLRARSILRIIRLFTVLQKHAAYFHAQRRTKDTFGTGPNNCDAAFVCIATSRRGDSRAPLAIVRRLNRAFFSALLIRQLLASRCSLRRAGIVR